MCDQPPEGRRTHPSLNHVSAPFTPEGWPRPVRRNELRPIARGEAEARIPRHACRCGSPDLRSPVRPGCPARPACRSLTELVVLIESGRREHSWSARATHLERARPRPSDRDIQSSPAH